MALYFSYFRFLVLALLVGLMLRGIAIAGEQEVSVFGSIAIPSPAKPVNAEQCVEPVEIMRRDHMKFLLHQRDNTVLDGERDSSYSLVGCMNCHNPGEAGKPVVRYENPEHFCADCHRYASVKIDCFECHADRGLEISQQSQLSPGQSPHLSMQTFQHQLRATNSAD